jgi:hypothetical protein
MTNLSVGSFGKDERMLSHQKSYTEFVKEDKKTFGNILPKKKLNKAKSIRSIKSHRVAQRHYKMSEPEELSLSKSRSRSKS